MSKSDDSDGVTGELLEIMRRLRDPNGGCPWDLEQNFSTIAPYTIEEAYEVSDAIERGDFEGLREELGDLLLQVVFHAQMAEEEGLFAYDDVVRAICDKMVRRHPHVFGPKDLKPGDAKTQAKTSGGVTKAWEQIKREERAAKASEDAEKGLLEDVPVALPALSRAIKLQNRAAEVGFDWPSAVSVIEKIVEEAKELADAQAEAAPEKIAEEYGDLLFVMANLARHLKIDPEASLRATNAKFVRRFKAIEEGLQAAGNPIEDASLEEMEALWRKAKEAERTK